MDVYAELAGFDERYFLYYEDIDLCRRLRERGWRARALEGKKHCWRSRLASVP